MGSFFENILKQCGAQDASLGGLAEAAKQKMGGVGANLGGVIDKIGLPKDGKIGDMASSVIGVINIAKDAIDKKGGLGMGMIDEIKGKLTGKEK